MKILEKTIAHAAKVLNIEVDELQLWLDQHQGITPYTQVQLLRLASKHLLDPLSDEISIMETKEGFLPYITIDGWAKLMNQHPQYAGMSLREPTESNSQLPTWMECTIYRNDRILPIVVKEYLEEVMTNHPSWQQMPRRMLRHRVIQQCARLAFGISAQEGINIENKKINNLENKNSFSTEKNRTEQLKEIMCLSKESDKKSYQTTQKPI
jgi:hypothetical protein